jgi:hypothetical protein
MIQHGLVVGLRTHLSCNATYRVPVQFITFDRINDACRLVPDLGNTTAMNFHRSISNCWLNYAHTEKTPGGVVYSAHGSLGTSYEMHPAKSLSRERMTDMGDRGDIWRDAASLSFLPWLGGFA